MTRRAVQKLVEVYVKRLGLDHSVHDLVHAVHAKKLTAIAPLQEVRLALANNYLGDAGVRAFAGGVAFEGLTHLDLSANCFSDAGAQALAGSTALKGLTHLNLFYNGIGDAGAQALAASPHLQCLTHLDLYYNDNIGDAGMRALAGSTALKGLTDLRVNADRVPHFVRALAEARLEAQRRRAGEPLP